MSSHLSRADLLKVLSASATHKHLYPGLVEALGFEERDAPPSTELRGNGQNSAADDDGGANSTANAEDVLYLPKREPRYWIVERCQPQARQPLDSGDWPETEPEDVTAPQPLPAHPLRSDGQWQNLWDSALTGRRRGRTIHLKRSLRLLVRNEPVRDLPRCERSSFNRPVVIMLEWSEALYPIWPDMRAAWVTLSRLLGKRALRGFYVADGPFNEWRCLHRRGRGSYIDIPAASQVILVGRFGVPRGEKSGETSGETNAEISAEWRQLIRQLHKDGHQIALIAARHLRHSPCLAHALEPTPLSSLQSSPLASPMHKACDALLAAIARHCLPNRQQLRHLRRAMPGAGVAAELAVWQHPQTLCLDGYLQITDSAVNHWRKRWPSLCTPALEQALADCRASQDGAARDMSALQRELDQVPQARQFPALQSLGKAVAQCRKKGQRNSHVQFLLRNLLPGLRELAETRPEKDWQPLMAEAQRVAMHTHEPLPLKDQGLEEVAGRYYLFQQRQQLRLRPEFGAGHLPLLELSSLPYCRETRGILPVLSPKAYNALQLADRDYGYGLQAIRRPAWAERIWRSHDGLFAAHQDGALFQLEAAGPDRPQSRWRLLENPWPWADEVGVDEDHRLWAEFSLGKARQRLRWIPPGSFIMGSPDNEEGRDDDETQHSVTLTHGYWLGETSCTQALWQAVMGKKLSYRKGDDLPVEQVSWQDCQSFIAKLGKRLPGLNPALPSEVQWEYACRAGTKTTYWWGDEMDKKYANNGGQTEVEAGYPTNAFGLRSMSGNVDEWCADWFGDYSTEPVIDPTGPAEGRLRVLRGGSWLGYGRSLRSAYRYADAPVNRNLSIGVRLAGGYVPQASTEARPMSADRLARSARRSGAQGAGEGLRKGER